VALQKRYCISVISGYTGQVSNYAEHASREKSRVNILLHQHRIVNAAESFVGVRQHASLWDSWVWSIGRLDPTIPSILSSDSVTHQLCHGTRIKKYPGRSGSISSSSSVSKESIRGVIHEEWKDETVLSFLCSPLKVLTWEPLTVSYSYNYCCSPIYSTDSNGDPIYTTTS